MHVARGVLALGLLACSAPLLAQNDSARPVPDAPASRLLTHTFTTPSREFVRVRLAAGETYRVSISDGRVKLDIHPMAQGVQSPQIRQRNDDAHLATYDVEPRASGEYEIRIIGTGDHRVRLTVDRTQPPH